VKRAQRLEARVVRSICTHGVSSRRLQVEGDIFPHVLQRTRRHGEGLNSLKAKTRTPRRANGDSRGEAASWFRSAEKVLFNLE